MSGKYALLIANSHFGKFSPDVMASEADAHDLAKVLADPEIGGFEITMLIDQDWAHAQTEIARFCLNRHPDDLVLIYYSGAAMRIHDGDFFFSFKDTELDVLSATAIGGPFLIKQLSSCRSKHMALILDTVHSGAVLDGTLRIPEGLVILAASGPGEFAFEESIGSRDGGIFTHYLIEGLRTGDADLDGDGDVTFDELLTYAKRHVEARKESQRPRLFNFAESPIIAAKAARHVFISYSRTDASFATSIRDELVARGHKAWMDEKGIAGGEDWRVRIGSAIDGAKAIVAILSPEALSSTWVRRELDYADSMGRPIVPVIYKECALPSWYKLQFGGLQRVDFTATQHQEALETLLRSIKEVLRSRSRSLGNETPDQ